MHSHITFYSVSVLSLSKFVWGHPYSKYARVNMVDITAEWYWLKMRKKNRIWLEFVYKTLLGIPFLSQENNMEANFSVKSYLFVSLLIQWWYCLCLFACFFFFLMISSWGTTPYCQDQDKFMIVTLTTMMAIVMFLIVNKINRQTKSTITTTY